MKDSTTSSSTTKHVLPVMLEDESQVPAAMVVLAGLYGVKPVCPRMSREVGSVQLTWPLCVSAVQKAAQSSCNSRASQTLRCHSTTAPFAGIAWSLALECSYNADGMGSMVGVYAMPIGVPPDLFLRFSCSLKIVEHMEEMRAEEKMQTGSGCYGWDAEAWAAQGLPTSGELKLVLTMTSPAS